MIKRLFRVFLFLILLAISPAEIVYYLLRWIIIGKKFPAGPLCTAVIVFDSFAEYKDFGKYWHNADV